MVNALRRGLPASTGVAPSTAVAAPPRAAVASSGEEGAPAPLDGPCVSVPLLLGDVLLPCAMTVGLTAACLSATVREALSRYALLSRALSAVRDAAAPRHKYGKEHHMQLYALARDIQERRRPLVLLLCGTSGSGKSTLASLLASRCAAPVLPLRALLHGGGVRRLGVQTVVSTDSVRHFLRGVFTVRVRGLSVCVAARSRQNGRVDRRRSSRVSLRRRTKPVLLFPSTSVRR